MTVAPGKEPILNRRQVDKVLEKWRVMDELGKLIAVVFLSADYDGRCLAALGADLELSELVDDYRARRPKT